MSVARQVTRLATGLPPAKPEPRNDSRSRCTCCRKTGMSEDLPFGSRGGIAIHYDFPVDGEYLIKVRLQRQYQDYLKGMGWPQQLDIRLDGKLLKRFTVGGAGQGPARRGQLRGRRRAGLCRRSRVGNVHAAHRRRRAGSSRSGPGGSASGRRVVRAGDVGAGRSSATAAARPSDRERPGVHGLRERGLGPDRRTLRRRKGPAKDTASRRAIFVCQPPKAAAEERACAATILSRMARLAYRRPATKADTDTLLEFFDNGRQDGGSFDTGIQFALERMLVDPDFLLRVISRSGDESRPAYRLSDLELASRLSFFLWSSIPDDHLLTLAEHKRAQQSADSGKRSAAHAGRPARHRRAGERFRRAVAESAPASRKWWSIPTKYPNYDESLLQAFQQETEMFVGSTLREDRSVTDLLDADYTFVNERLARHYGIPGVYGSRFRRVTLPESRSARRVAGARGAAGDHVLSRPHVAGAARQMAAEQYLRHADPAASAGSERDARNQARRHPADHARTAGPAPHAIRRATVAIR